MGSVSRLFISENKEVTISRVTGFGASGIFKVSIGGIIHRVSSAFSGTIKVGDTALLNKSPHGKYYITGITSGLGNSKNIMEIIKNG